MHVARQVGRERGRKEREERGEGEREREEERSKEAQRGGEKSSLNSMCTCSSLLCQHSICITK